jgi:hypothetical protein
VRTIAVFVGGLIVTLAADAIMTKFVTPDFNHLLIRMFTTPPESKEWSDISHQWHHANMISVFLLAPVAGFASGIFVGLLQRNHAPLVAASTQIPELLLLACSDKLRPWASSAMGVTSFLGQHFLPVVTAMLGALLSRYLLVSREAHSNTSNYENTQA